MQQIDEDYYFRPWKVYKDLADGVKKMAKNDPKFVGIASENKEFLSDLFLVAGAKEEYLDNEYKAFWSSTHLFGLLDCESYWTPNERIALSKRIPVGSRKKIEELACKVWQRRFINSGCELVMGAPLSLDIFQVIF
jgi:hypothetical protein